MAKRFTFIFILLITLPLFAQSQNYNTWELQPLYGGYFFASTISYATPDTLWVGGTDFMAGTENGGVQWNSANNASHTFSLVQDIFVDPNHPENIFVNEFSALTVSADNGLSWEVRFFPTDMFLEQMAVCGANTNVIYGIPNYPATGGIVYKTTDQGKTWSSKQNWSFSLRTIDVSQQNPDHVYVSSNDSIYYSPDGGTSWQRISDAYHAVSPEYSLGISIYVSPFDDNTIVAVKGQSIDAITISYDHGQNWQRISLPYRQHYNKVTFANSSTMYLGTEQYGALFSSDSGKTWNALETNGLLNKNIIKILPNPKKENTLYAVTSGNGIFKSTDHGSNWLEYNKGLTNVEINKVIEKPGNPDMILAGSVDGGVYRSIDGGNNWNIINQGIDDLNIVDIIWPANAGNKIGIITNNKGFYRSVNDGASWVNAQNGDALTRYVGMAYDSVASRIYVCGSEASSGNKSPVIYSDDWGDNWHILPVPTDFPNVVNDIEYNNLNSSLYVAGADEIYRYNGSGWVKLSGDFFTTENRGPVTIVLNPRTTDTLYATAGYGYAYRATNNGTVWEKIYPYGGYKNIIVDKYMPGLVYILGNSQQKSYEGGDNWHYIDSKENVLKINNIGGDISRSNRQVIYIKSRTGLYKMTQSGEYYSVGAISSQVFTYDSTTLNLPVKNNGNSILYLNNLHLNGAHKNHWRFVEKKSNTLRIDPFKQDTLVFRFVPDSVGDLSASLIGTSNDPQNPGITINLQGTGVGPLLSLSATNIGLGDVFENSVKDTLIRLTNTGNYKLKIFEIKFSGTGSSFFNIVDESFPILINPGEFKDVKIRFQPTTTGDFNTTMKITSKDTYQAVKSVMISANVIKRPRGNIVISKNSFDFGTVLVDDSSAVKEVTISNSSSELPLTIDSIQISSTYFSFSPEKSIPFSIDPQQQIKVGIVFIPHDSINYNGELSIYSDADNNTLLKINLKGKGKYPVAPQVQIDPSGITASAGSNASVSMTVSADLPIQSAMLYYRKGGDVNFKSTAFSVSNGNTYTATIASSYLTARGLNYYIEVKDGQNTVRYPESGTLNMTVSVTNLDRAIVGDGVYQMISVPMQLTDGSPLSVLSDNLGEYDKFKWRLFHWSNGKYVEANESAQSIGNFEPGKAFWLASKSGTSFNTGAGKSTSVADSIVINLEKGWNQIASPYDFTVSWNSVKFTGNIASDLWGYKTDTKSYAMASTLQPWEGYFVKALDSGTSLVFYPVSTSSTTIQKLAGTPTESGGWKIQLSAQCNSSSDRANFIGMNPYADDEYDDLDHFEPPAIGDQVSLSFDHNDWKTSGIYSADIRSENDEGARWDFDVRSYNKDNDITLNLHTLDAFPGDFELWLIDHKNNIPVNITGRKAYHFKWDSGDKKRSFTILVGKNDFINSRLDELDLAPASLLLLPNYPNPFNPVTVIKFGLPVDQAVSLDIYDVLGKKVRTLLTHTVMKKGFHTQVWNGRNEQGVLQSSGLYFAILHSGKNIKTIKMMLIK